MYKVYYYSDKSSGLNFVKDKTFDTLEEATEFSLKLPAEAVLEIKHYESVEKQKPDRN